MRGRGACHEGSVSGALGTAPPSATTGEFLLQGVKAPKNTVVVFGQACVHTAGGNCRSNALASVLTTRLFTLPGATRGNVLSLHGSGTVVPLLTSAAAAPWCPSHTGAGDASHKVLPVTVNCGGCSPPHLMWEISHRARGPWITKCYQSVVPTRACPGIFAIGVVSFLGVVFWVPMIKFTCNGHPPPPSTKHKCHPTIRSNSRGMPVPDIQITTKLLQAHKNGRSLSQSSSLNHVL